MLRASFLQKKCVESIDSSTGTQAIVAFVEVVDDVDDGTVLMMVLYFTVRQIVRISNYRHRPRGGGHGLTVHQRGGRGHHSGDISHAGGGGRR